MSTEDSQSATAKTIAANAASGLTMYVACVGTPLAMMTPKNKSNAAIMPALPIS